VCREKETHAAQLAALGEELDQQLAKTEAKAKAEARQEAQRQMEAERKKIAMEMETQMADLGKQLRTFQKVSLIFIIVTIIHNRFLEVPCNVCGV